MSTAIEALATVIILVFLILLVTHSINNTAGEWVKSKFKVSA